MALYPMVGVGASNYSLIHYASFSNSSPNATIFTYDASALSGMVLFTESSGYEQGQYLIDLDSGNITNLYKAGDYQGRFQISCNSKIIKGTVNNYFDSGSCSIIQ